MEAIEFNGKIPQIHKTARIFSGAKIIGDVAIGEDSSVWFDSILRGDLGKIVIGSRTNIQDLTIIHTLQPTTAFPNGLGVSVGSGVTIGHRVTLHACKISDNCLIGMGSIVMDDVELGEGCWVSAFSLLQKGKKYPPNSLISGNPAKIVRPLREEEIQNIKNEAALYVGLKNQYTRGF